MVSKKTSALLIGILPAVMAVASLTHNHSFLKTVASGEIYTRNLILNDTNTPTISEGNAILNTRAHNADITIIYNNVKDTISDGAHIDLYENGYFYKTAASNELTSVNATFVGSLAIYTGGSLDDLTFKYNLISGENTSIIGNYFKVVAEEETVVNSVTFGYGCLTPITISPHVYAEQYSHDETHHWKECVAHANCISKIEYEAHDHSAELITKPEYQIPGSERLTCSICSETHVSKIPALTYNGIGVYNPAARSEYIVGESFSANGLAIRKAENGVLQGENVEFTYTPTGALTLDDHEILVKYTNEYGDEYTTTIDISVSNGVSIETEDANTITGGEIARTGMVAGYASGSAMTRNFGEGGTMKFFITANEDVTSNIYIVGASACVSEYVNGVPLVTEDMQLNKLLTLQVNGEEIAISDDAVFEGKRFETADYKNLANWTNVYLNKINLVKGDNEILFTFKASPYVNADEGKTTASPFYDKMMLTGEGISHNTEHIEAPDEPELPELTATTKIEAENMEISGATKAGNQSLHPGYANSGVASNYSNQAFVKNFNAGGYLKYTCKVSTDTSISLNLAGSPTSTNTAVDLKNIFKLFINGEEVSINGDATYVASSTTWLVRDGDFGTYDVTAGTLEIEFKVISTTESIFVDYLDISIL